VEREPKEMIKYVHPEDKAENERIRREGPTVKAYRDPPCKMCLMCYLIVHNGTRVCYECGYEFYPSKKK
jgi:hypothetical protein